jgi:hypothetical protein
MSAVTGQRRRRVSVETVPDPQISRQRIAMVSVWARRPTAPGVHSPGLRRAASGSKPFSPVTGGRAAVAPPCGEGCRHGQQPGGPDEHDIATAKANTHGRWHGLITGSNTSSRTP